jgi:hypothetical protein
MPNLGVGRNSYPISIGGLIMQMYQGQIKNRIYRTKPLIPEHAIVFIKGLYAGMITLLMGLTVLIALTF